MKIIKEQIDPIDRAEANAEKYGNLSAPDDLGFQKRFIKGLIYAVAVGFNIVLLSIACGYILVKAYYLIF